MDSGRDFIALGSGLDRIAVRRRHQRPNLMTLAAGLGRPTPSDAMLGAAIGCAGIGRNQ